MKEERLAVLRLLENGVINADEAERLLNTLRPLPPGRYEMMGEKRAAFNEKMSAAGENIANFAKKAGKTVGQKTESAAKKAEPMIKKAAEKLGEKTEEVCTSAKNYVDKKKAEREKSYVPDIKEEDVSEVTDEQPASEPAQNTSEDTAGDAYFEAEKDDSAQDEVFSAETSAQESAEEDAPAEEDK